MNHEDFSALMPFIVSDLINTISNRQAVSEQEALFAVYNSKLYSLLENEKTKVWQYSTEMLYSLFVQEQKTGTIEFPDV